MKGREDTWDELLGCVYDASVDPSSWPRAIELATDLLEARQAKLAITSLAERQEVRPILHRLDPALQERWFEEFAHRDPWTQALGYLPAGFVDAGSEVVPHAELRRTEIYHEFLRPDRVEDILGAWLGEGPGGISHVIFYRDTLFDRRQLRLLERLAPHLRRAVRTQERLLEMAARLAPAEAALDQFQPAVWLLEADGRVRFANRRAEELARAADGIEVRSARLRLRRPDEMERLAGAILSAARAARGTGHLASESLAVSRGFGRRPLSLMVTPLRPRDRQVAPLLPRSLHDRAGVLVTATDPEDIPLPAAEHLAAHFGFTAAEARLAAALATRQSLEEYAEQAGITIGTARWTLKNALSKAGCRRQSELVQLVATSIASLQRRPD